MAQPPPLLAPLGHHLITERSSHASPPSIAHTSGHGQPPAAAQTLARSALRADLHRSQAELTLAVLRSTVGAATAIDARGRADVVAAWTDRHERLLIRWRAVVADLASGAPPALDQLSVTVREFRNLLHQVTTVTARA